MRSAAKLTTRTRCYMIRAVRGLLHHLHLVNSVAKWPLPEEDGGTVDDLLGALKIRTEERGITFIDGSLSAMPGLQPDLDHILKNGPSIESRLTAVLHLGHLERLLFR